MAMLRGALAALNAAIERGEEFPDACGRAAFRFGVDYDELRTEYDEACCTHAEPAQFVGMVDEGGEQFALYRGVSL